MKKIIGIAALFLVFSCQHQEVQLPLANKTIVADVVNHSSIYFFFNVVAEDTLAKVNRNNTISATNWIFNIDKRLPLRKVILEVKKLQDKKEGSAHKSEVAENYFSYTDTVRKKMAFLPFTKVKYKLEIPDKYRSYICFKKNDIVKFNDVVSSKEQLPVFLNALKGAHSAAIVFSYDKDLSFGEYIEDKIFVKNLTVKKTIRINHHLEYIF